MLAVYILFFVPLILFVLAFLYETYLSFARLKNAIAGRSGYVHATWEVTHTLLIFAVVVLLMFFTNNIDEIADAIFMTTMFAAVALVIRSICYTYIFYVRTSKKTNWVDWVFAVSHIFAALFLVATVVEAVWYLYQNSPDANTQFVPAFIPGLVLVVGICAVPIGYLYFTKHK